MKKTLLQKTLILLVIPMTFACNRDVECPGLPADDMSWIPYQKGDTLRFRNMDEGDTLTLIMDYVSKTEPYSIKKDCDCNCEMNASMKTTMDPNYGIGMEMTCRKDHNKVDYNYNFVEYVEYGGNYMTFADTWRLSLVSGTPDVACSGDMHVDGKVYHDVYKATDMIFANEMATDVYITNSVGLISFYYNGFDRQGRMELIK